MPRPREQPKQEKPVTVEQAVYELMGETIYERTKLGEVGPALKAIRDQSRDLVVTGNQVSALVMPESPIGWGLEIDVPGEGKKPFLPNPWGVMQTAERTNALKYKYLQAMQAAKYHDLICQNVNRWLADRESPLLVRTVGNVVRAVLGDHYMALDNYAIFNFAANAINDENNRRIAAAQETGQDSQAVKPIGLWDVSLSPSKIYIRTIDTSKPYYIRGEKEPHFAGWVIENTEVGDGAFIMRYLLFRVVCKNGITHEEQGLRRTHLGSPLKPGIYTPETIALRSAAIFSEIKDNFAFMINNTAIFDEWINTLNNLTQVKLVDPVKTVRDINVNLNIGLSEKDLEKVVNALTLDETVLESHRGTMYAVVQAYTGAANQMPHNKRFGIQRAMGTIKPPKAAEA